VGLLRTLFSIRYDVPRVVPLLRDAAVPVWAKVGAIAAAILIVSPLNVLGDLPLLGLVDDAALLGLVIHVFVSYAERRTAGMKNVTPGAP